MTSLSAVSNTSRYDLCGCLFHKRRLATGILVIIEIIFTLGISLKKSSKLRERWNFAFKIRKVAQHSSTIINTSSHSYHNLAQKIMEKNASYPSQHFVELYAKAMTVSELLFENKENMTQIDAIIGKIKQRTANAANQVSKHLFKLSFKSMMEFKEKELLDTCFSSVAVGKSTEALLGKQLYQMKLNNGQDIHLSVQKLIGQGSFNQASLALDVTNEKIRVYRLLKAKKFNKDVKIIYNLFRENTIHMKLQEEKELKRRMIRLHGTFSSHPFHGSVLSFADKGTLREAIDQKSLSKDEKKDILVNVATFLRDLHIRNYILGDFKPDNIFLKTAKGKILVKFGDFGGTHLVGDAGTSVITPVYMAPEVHGNFKTTTFTDCWAFGILLYQMRYQEKPKEMDVPDFVKDALKILNFYRDHSYKKKEKVTEVQELFERNLSEIDKVLDKSDAYDSLIIDLLKYKPEERIDAPTLLERVQNISSINF